MILFTVWRSLGLGSANIAYFIRQSRENLTPRKKEKKGQRESGGPEKKNGDGIR